MTAIKRQQKITPFLWFNNQAREAAIEEAKEHERRGLLDIEPPIGLLEQITEKCRQKFEAEEHKRKMETSFCYRTFNNFCDYVKHWYK